ncbi:hypothetical protein C2G38_2066003 [Gigaspora rosea]|uniref:Uncharacterized protein n=1 Tax=Gigaspora rosea TaxID=44941 RepID=A0A397VVP6_9GLOM|nr:hypothetical protein C2G38_2066003 [Gigaspora rosea]
MLIQQIPKKIGSSLFQFSITLFSILFIISSLIQQVNSHIIVDESFSTINQMLIRRQPKRPRKRPIQQKTICEAECWAALLVVGILVLFCLSCIMHDFVVRKRKRKLDTLKKVAELESVKINKAFSEKQSNNGSTNVEMSRDQQMRNIRTGVKQLKESYKIEHRWPKKKRKIMKGLALRNGHLEPIAEEEEENTEKCENESTEGEKSDTLVDDESVKNISEDGSEDGSEDLNEEESKIPEERTLHEINKGKQKEIMG